MRYVTHLESALDGTRLDAERVQTLHRDRPLWVRYDLESIGGVVDPQQIAKRAPTLWRYRELLPLDFDVEPVTLGEGMSPLLSCPRLAEAVGTRQLLIKDESQLPTGSFKSRGMTMAISMARAFGIERVALPSAGNAGGAAAAYAACGGLECYVFMPEDTPVVNQLEAVLAGAHTYRVNGLINDCGGIVRRGKDAMQWFDLSTLKEPYRIEGKKTMGLELAEQLDWELPDVIFYPTGGGTGLIGMWKAFRELQQLGWLRREQLPRMVVCQSTGCPPIVRAFEKGERFAEHAQDAATIASGIRVPAAVGDFMILDAVRESGGVAVAADEQCLRHWMQRGTALSGISICPETAACLEGVRKLRDSEWLTPDERVVVFNTGAAQKYVEAMEAELPFIDLNEELDYSSL